ncbi:MAG: PH domain-containing protein [Actinomycetota bacterium]|nr:PH domain-containing protein [Actinomycetota bacterium]
MPAGSDAAPAELPRTFRPFGVRIAVSVFAVLLYGTVLAIWVAFPAEVRSQFTIFQRATVIFFGVAMAACGFALARSRVEVRVDSVTVVNGYRTRRYDWNEILAVTLPQGSPWATLDLSDGTSVAAMGIQGSDGARAGASVRQIRALLRQQSRTERND